MTDLSNIDEVYFFKFSIDDDCRDGTYSEPRKIRAQNNAAATLKKIWAVFSKGQGVSSTHGRARHQNGHNKLSIKRPGNLNGTHGKKLLLFAIASDGYFDKGKDNEEDPKPIVFEGKSKGFSDPFFLVEDHGTMKIVPLNSGATIPDEAWAGIVLDNSEFDESHTYRFDFNLEITKPCPGSGNVVFPVAPDDPWPGPPHNTVDP